MGSRLALYFAKFPSYSGFRKPETRSDIINMVPASSSATVLEQVQESHGERDSNPVSMGQKKKSSKKSGGQGSSQTGSTQGAPQKMQEAAVQANGILEGSNAESGTGGQQRA